MPCISNTNMVAMAIMLFGCCSALTNVHHPGVRLKSGMVYMPGNTDKLFGVDIHGNLQERIHTGGSWHWVNHGNGGERLSASTPCILQDGKIFVISVNGNLFERKWAGHWLWTNHHRHSHQVKIRTSGCTCTNTNGPRVFVVGVDLQLYERFWNIQINAPDWRKHPNPNPSVKIGFNIDSCNQPGCATEVYVAGSDGNLWKRRLIGGSTFQWQNMGRPHHLQNEFVHSVRIGGNSKQGLHIFVGTNTDQICRFWSTNNFGCYGRPHGSGLTSLAHIEMSEPIYVGPGCNRLRSGWHIALNSWDPTYHRRGRMFTLRLTSSNHYVFEQNVSGSYAKVNAPLFFKSGTCPKIFSVNSNGDVWERL